MSFDNRVNKEIEKDIYKVQYQFRINISDWINDKNNSGYAIIGTNYSDDYEQCDIVFYTTSQYGKLGKLVRILNKTESKEYGYIQSAFGLNIDRS